MHEAIKEAKNKIDKELKEFKGATKAKAVSDYVAKTLKQFCDVEAFAAAVIKSEKTLTDCCNEIMAKVGNHVSDLEVYKKAAQFYFPGSKVEFNMTINVEGKDSKVDEVIEEHREEHQEEPIKKVKKKTESVTLDDTIQISLF